MYCVIRGNEDLRLSAVAGTNVVNRLANEAIPLSVKDSFCLNGRMELTASSREPNSLTYSVK